MKEQRHPIMLQEDDCGRAVATFGLLC